MLCGRAPYDDLTNTALVVAEIAKGTRPKKPEDATNLGITDELWETVERCWSTEKDGRPSLGAVVSCLKLHRTRRIDYN